MQTVIMTTKISSIFAVRYTYGTLEIFGGINYSKHSSSFASLYYHNILIFILPETNVRKMNIFFENQIK